LKNDCESIHKEKPYRMTEKRNLYDSDYRSKTNVNDIQNKPIIIYSPQTEISLP